MKRNLILAASATILGLAFSGPALANGWGGDTSIDITKTYTKTTTVGDITFSPTFAPVTTTSVTKVIADQDLKAVNVNYGMDSLVENEEGGFDSGNNSVNDNAFAAFAGILNQSWNTGIDANNQAASNVAAQGTVTFQN